MSTGLFGVQAETSVLPLGCELNCVILLEPQQIKAGDPQQQMIAGLKTTVSQGWEESLSTAL